MLKTCQKYTLVGAVMLILPACSLADSIDKPQGATSRPTADVAVQPAPAPTTSGEAPTSAPSDSAASADDAKIDALLDRLDVRGKQLSDFSADLKLSTIDNTLGDESARLGTIAYQRRPDGTARLRVVFDKRILGDKPPRNEKLEYLLDDGTLIERDYRLKKEITRQIAKPGDKTNLLKLGEGPFPLPLGQDKRDVHALFDVKLIPASKEDPADASHLQLLPKAGTRLARKFQSIDVWVSGANDMPIRIQTLDVNGATTIITDLVDIRVNSHLPNSAFTPSKLPEGWQHIDEPFTE
jgi:hypothetical protein